MNSICFTGKLENFTRKSAQEAAKNAGLDVWPSVKKNLTYLCAADPESGSSKMCKAEEFGITIISESQFMNMIGMKNNNARTIYDVIEDEEGERPDDAGVKDCIEDVLRELFEYGSGAEDLANKNITFKQFIDIVFKKLTDGSLEFNEDWDDGEVYMMIENTARDIIDGSEDGEHANWFKQVLGTTPDGKLNRCFGMENILG